MTGPTVEPAVESAVEPTIGSTADLLLTLSKRDLGEALVTINPSIEELFGGPFAGFGEPVLALSATTPWGDHGLIDVYRPGRWDCTTDTVFLSAIVDGEFAGEWEGSVCYLTFTPPEPGRYLMAVAFSGRQVSLILRGSFGEATHPSTGTGTPVLVTGTWSSVPGQSAYATITFREKHGWAGIGYLLGIRFYRVGD